MATPGQANHERERRAGPRSGLKTLVFLVGVVLEGYGLFYVLASGAVLKGIMWFVAGLLLHIAGGSASEPGQRGRLENPLVVLSKGLHDTRERVETWDKRPPSAGAVEQQDAADGAGKMERRS